MAKKDPERAAFDNGVDEGRRQMKADVLEWLQQEYLGPGAPDRDSPEGEAILQLAHRLSQEVKR